MTVTLAVCLSLMPKVPQTWLQQKRTKILDAKFNITNSANLAIPFCDFARGFEREIESRQENESRGKNRSMIKLKVVTVRYTGMTIHESIYRALPPYSRRACEKEGKEE